MVLSSADICVYLRLKFFVFSLADRLVEFLLGLRAAAAIMKPMSRVSAGIVLYETEEGVLRVLLAHPGGPFEKKDDRGRWSIPKGEVDEGEDLLACARREFFEETGHDAGDGPFHPLGEITQKGGKVVHAWATPGKWDPAKFQSNTFTTEWPPKSGRMREFPEVDKAEMLPLEAACALIKETQWPLLARLAQTLGIPAPSEQR
jgi:predicted NUDIX family NTP pyrophosphohydrolase